jgi:hypothetical protein
MNIFITLLENVNKSRTSANNLSLTNVFMSSGMSKIKCHVFYHNIIVCFSIVAITATLATQSFPYILRPLAAFHALHDSVEGVEEGVEGRIEGQHKNGHGHVQLARDCNVRSKTNHSSNLNT